MRIGNLIILFLPHRSPGRQELEAGEAALTGQDEVAGVHTAPQPSLPLSVQAALTK